MTPAWQEAVYAAALGAFVGAVLVAWMRHEAWQLIIALGLALVTVVALWNAAALD